MPVPVPGPVPGAPIRPRRGVWGERWERVGSVAENVVSYYISALGYVMVPRKIS